MLSFKQFVENFEENTVDDAKSYIRSKIYKKKYAAIGKKAHQISKEKGGTPIHHTARLLRMHGHDSYDAKGIMKRHNQAK